MKYMTFNSSCSYAGIANMLEAFGIDKEDYEIALGMKLPYLFKYDNISGTFRTGISIQDKTSFNLYLNTLGVNLEDAVCTRIEALQALRTTNATIMIGILLEENKKHAVLFTERRGNQYVFMNNRYQDSSEPAEYVYDDDELSRRIKEPAALGWLVARPPETGDFLSELNEALSVLHRYSEKLHEFCEAPQSYNALRSTTDSLFRPLLLDGLTMMQLIGNDRISFPLKQLQAKYLSALKKRCELTLKDELPMEQIDFVIDEYITLIKEQIALIS